jgi:hypothetical protein
MRVLALLALDLLLQNLQVKTSQRIRTQTAALVTLVAGDGGVFLQQLRDSAEDVVFHAIGIEGLEQ